MDEQTFTQKVLGCERKLYRISRTLLARDEDCRDAVQEALIRAWRSRGALRDERYFDTWLVRIVINECRTLYRKNRLQVHVPPARALASSVGSQGRGAGGDDGLDNGARGMYNNGSFRKAVHKGNEEQLTI